MTHNSEQKAETIKALPNFIRSEEPRKQQSINSSINKMLIVKSAISNQSRYMNDNYPKFTQVKLISLAKWRSNTIGKKNSFRIPKMLSSQKYDTMLPELYNQQTTSFDQQNCQINNQRFSPEKLVTSMERKIRLEFRRNTRTVVSKKCLTESTQKSQIAKNINFTDIFSIKKIEKILKTPARLFKKYTIVQMEDKVRHQNDSVIVSNKIQTEQMGKKISVHKITRDIEKQKTMNILNVDTRQGWKFFREQAHFACMKDCKDLSGWQTTSVADF